MGTQSCVFETLDALIDDVYTFVHEGESGPVCVEVVDMTEEEYNNLQEFNGW